LTTPSAAAAATEKAMTRNDRPRPALRALSLAITTLLLCTVTGQAMAQAAERAAERRAKAAQQRGQDTNQAQAAVAAQYPDATRKEPEGQPSSKLRDTLGKLIDAFNAKDTATVLKLADGIIANPDGNAYDHATAARLAGASLLNADNGRAKAYLQQAIDFNGLSNNDQFESMRLIAQIALNDQDYAGALAASERFLQESNSKNGDDLALKGNALYRLKRYPEAIAAMKLAVDSSAEPKAEWLELLMGAYFDSNQPQEAARIAEGLMAKHPDDTALQLNLASSYMQAGQDDKATAMLEKLRVSGGLDKPEDLRNLYAMYLNHNKNKEGIAVIEDGLKKGLLKEDFATLNALAQAYWFSGRAADAIATYRKAAPLAPDGETYLNLARALLNEGQTAEARQAAQQALDKGVRKPADAKTILGAGK
jgi:tetratricopeptide (TPR) repeat protein